MSTWCEKSLFYFILLFLADTTVLNELRRTGAVKNESRTQSHFASNICFLDLVTSRSDVLNHHKCSQPVSAAPGQKPPGLRDTRLFWPLQSGAQHKMTFASF